MKYAPEALGFFVVVPLIAAGLWYFPGTDRTGVLSPAADGALAGRGGMSCGNQVDWASDDQELFVRYRGGSDFETRLSVLDPTGNTSRVPFDNVGVDIANAAALFLDERHVLIGTHCGRLWWVDRFSESEHQLIVDLHNECSITSIAVADDGGRIAAGSANGQILLLSADRSAEERIVPPSAEEQQSSISALKFSRDGERLLAARNDGRLDLYSASSNRRLQSFRGHHGIVKGAHFLPDGRRIISAGLDDTVRIWDIENGREVWRGDFGLQGLNALDVSRIGNLVAWGGNSRRIIVWDLETSRSRFQVESGLSTVFGLRFSKDGTRLAAVGSGAEVLIYDTRTGSRLKSLAVDVP